MYEMAQAQEAAAEKIDALQAENHQLRQELRQKKKKKAKRSPPKKKEANKQEETIMRQLESSIVDLAEKVQHLEHKRVESEVATPRGSENAANDSNSGKSITDQLTQQLSDVWNFASSPRKQR